jgi:hypothetical protein
MRCCARAKMSLGLCFVVQVATLEELMLMLQVGYRLLPKLGLKPMDSYRNALACMHRCGTVVMLQVE